MLPLLLCTTGWLVGLVSRVAEDRKRVVCPVIDIISDETFAYVRSFEMHWGAFNWDLHFRWYTRAAPYERRRDVTEAFRTPAMAGGLFAMDKQYFFELGGYDEKMEVWGGENLELSFRVRTRTGLKRESRNGVPDLAGSVGSCSGADTRRLASGPVSQELCP